MTYAHALHMCAGVITDWRLPCTSSNGAGPSGVYMGLLQKSNTTQSGCTSKWSCTSANLCGEGLDGCVCDSCARPTSMYTRLGVS